MMTTTRYIVRFQYIRSLYLRNDANNGTGDRNDAAEFNSILDAAKKLLQRTFGYSDVEFIKVTKTTEQVITEKQVVTETIL